MQREAVTEQTERLIVREENWDNNRVLLTAEGFVEVYPSGEVSDDLAVRSMTLIYEMIEQAGGSICMYVDLDTAGRQSSLARKTWKEMTELPAIRKVGFTGTHPVARVLSAFIAGLSRKSSIKFYKTREEVMAWFRE